MTSFKLMTAAAAAALLAVSYVQAQTTERDKSAAREKSAQMKGDAGKSGKMAKQDRQAMMKMAQTDMAEIEAGKMAMQKASSPEVKKYAEHMVEAHTKMLEEGKKLAQAKGVTPPAGPDKKHLAAAKKLEQHSGEAFDRQYVEQMVKDHEDALKLVEKTAKDAKDPDLKAQAQKGAPHIKEHLAQARKLHASFGSSAGTSGASTKEKSK